MEIFISWSGDRSGACARALREWLPCVMQTVRPWCSSEDIAKGARGLDEIAQNLDKTNFGIVCLTPNNLHSEWINFEAGALSKKFGNSSLFTFLLDLHPAYIKPPLGLFQHTHASKDELYKLVQAVNSKTEKPLTNEVLTATFSALWPKLEDDLAKLPPDVYPHSKARPEREILEEILSTVRGQSQAQKIEKTSSSDVMRGKLSTLASFADGCFRARGHQAIVTAQLRGDDAGVLLVTLNDEKHSFPISQESPLGLTRTNILALARDKISDDDVPF